MKVYGNAVYNATSSYSEAYLVDCNVYFKNLNVTLTKQIKHDIFCAVLQDFSGNLKRYVKEQAVWN